MRAHARRVRTKFYGSILHASQSQVLICTRHTGFFILFIFYITRVLKIYFIVVVVATVSVGLE